MIRNIVQVTEEPVDLAARENSPGIIGYIASETDTLWQIAKENAATIEEIRRMNQLTDDRLQKGQRILIVKSGAVY
jgi:LysM repeat protein